MKIEISIPNIAENVETGIIANVLVSEGDEVDKDQPLVEVETDKASTDIPSPEQGKVVKITVKPGDEVKIDDVIMIMEVKEDGKEQEEKPGKEEEKEPEDKKQDEETDRVEKSAVDQPRKGMSAYEGMVPASPSVRRKAREAGVDLDRVTGSGPGNRITAEDIKKLAGMEEEDHEELPDFSKWGNVSRVSMDNIRKLTASRMREAWTRIPHVTQFDEADITGLEKFIQEQQEAFSQKGGKLTITAILLKISAFALQRFPRFNSSLDEKHDEIIVKEYFNIGIAVDTEHGLLVPVIREVERKSLMQLSIELTEIAQKARDKKISPDQLQGGNFSISNLGGIGGTAFTPIVYPPQVAVLGISRKQYKPVYSNGEIGRRMMLPLSLSYDHRVIDGAAGARFLRWICDVLEDPFALLQ